MHQISGALPWTPLGELTALPPDLAGFRGRAPGKGTGKRDGKGETEGRSEEGKEEGELAPWFKGDRRPLACTFTREKNEKENFAM